MSDLKLITDPSCVKSCLGERARTLSVSPAPELGSTQRIKPGDQLTWLHCPRGGYGYTTPVDAEVVRVNRVTVRIRVALRGGRLVERNVRPDSLRHRGGDHG